MPSASQQVQKWVDNPQYHFDEVEAEVQRVKAVRKVNRNTGGLSQSFRKHFLQKSPTTKNM